MLTMAMLLGLLVASLLYGAAALWFSARIVRAGHPSFKRALACGIVLLLAIAPVQLVGVAFSTSTLANQLIVGGIQLAIVLLLTWALTARVFHITFARSMLLSIPYFLLSIVNLLGIFFVFKPYCLEAFIMPTMSMAPTLIGWHHEATCPHCRGRAVVLGGAPRDEPERFGERAPLPRNGICRDCRKISEFEKWSDDVHAPMRFICNKLMQPQRGDAVVFVRPRRFDEKERVLYVKRLIGFPSERIEIKDEAVWINGKRWTPPSELAGLVYYATPNLPFPGEAQEPRSWELGPDEFFVLGDFTTNSSDSREWGPVPRANLVGPVTMIYWPQSAWRILR